MPWSYTKTGTFAEVSAAFAALTTPGDQFEQQQLTLAKAYVAGLVSTGGTVKSNLFTGAVADIGLRIDAAGHFLNGNESDLTIRLRAVHLLNGREIAPPPKSVQTG